MKRFGMAVQLKDDPEIITQYEECHANPWPAVREYVRQTGIKRVYIYRHERLLFMFMEAEDDFDANNMNAELTDPKMKEWDELMTSYQEALPGVTEGSTKWVNMKEIHSLEIP